jgi:single-stranded-DNA-specific exonuclease
MDRLELAEPVAITLVRRGHRTPEEARHFLEAEVAHDPAMFDGIGTATGLIATAARAGERITIHGDYDVDGMSATAILVTALRRAGADVDWLIPDRSADGYGLSESTLPRLLERGTRLLITADCGITSVAEVAAMRAAGIDVIVTDHHTPKDELPDAVIVHPTVSGYPFAGLCGAAVAHKLVEHLERTEFGRDPAEAAAADLDLVALATVADMVPLVDENRTLTRRGLAAMRLAKRPGLRALVDAAKIEPERLDEGDIAFRLAPRLNAAGRLYRADAGVELLSTADDARAAEIAIELDRANLERREVEREVYAGASTALSELPEDLREAAGLVLAGEGWHPGVVGIAASRMVERTGRPAILLSIDGSGRARGSGRGIPGFDLLAALEGCAAHLDRFGGHKAAAGVELPAAGIDAFREAFATAAAEQFPDGPPSTPRRIDAVVGPEALAIDVAEQFEALGPFGEGNPAIRLLVPWARAEDVRAMGDEGRHARFALASGPSRAGAVGFNAASALERGAGRHHDFAVRLELNHWNGSVEPRAVLDGKLGALADDAPAPCTCSATVDERWWDRFEEHVALEGDALDLPPDAAAHAVAEGRRRLAQAGRSPVALAGELLSSGTRVLVVAADARRRSRLAALAAAPERFGATYRVVCSSCGVTALSDAAAPVGEGGAQLVLTDWEALAAAPAAAGAFDHAIVVDRPASRAALEGLVATGGGWLHEAYAGIGLAEACLAERWQPREALAAIYRGLAAGPVAGAELGTLLAGDGPMPSDAAIAARCLRVLIELGLCNLDGERGSRLARVVSSERTELEQSGTWRACAARYEDGLTFLRSQTTN